MGFVPGSLSRVGAVGDILLYVATAMVKPAEVKQAFAQNRFHVVLIAYTAMMVILTDFLTGVLSVVIISGLLLSRVFDKPVESNEAAYELT